MHKEVVEAVRNCLTCQRHKAEHVQYPGLLQPLPIPNQPWTDISMDFVEGLPTSNQKSIVMVVVDRLTKYVHFIALSHPYTAHQVASVFFDQIHKLHGLPSTIVSDRDPIFLSAFWRQLFKMVGTKLAHSSAYHPQSDGQTERVNQCLENFLRCMSSDRPKQWATWLPMAEWWYNTTFHTALQLTPFEALYGYKPPQLGIPQEPKSVNPEVNTFLDMRRRALQLIKDNISSAQARMKFYADKNRSERAFEIGDWVFLRLQPYRHTTLAMRRNLKLAPKFYGPFQVIEKIGSVAYRLNLPSTAMIHPVFHVSLLKKKLGDNVAANPTLPPVDNSGQFLIEPIAVLDRRLVKRNNQAVVQLLVQWVNMPTSEATWEDYDSIVQRFPHFHP